MSWLGDARLSFRTLIKNPGFTTVAVSTLALAIGVNATVFTVTNSVLFKGFPLVDRNDRILYISTGRNCCASYPDFEDWRAQSKSFEGMAIVHGGQKSFSDNGGFPETYIDTDISAGTFKLTGQKPILGRDFAPSDEAPGAAPVVILRYSFWERHYGKDPRVLGHVVRINGQPATIVGIMPRGFSFPQNQDLWMPLTPTAELLKRENRGTWFVFGRLTDGATAKSARAEMETIGRRLGIAYPLTNQGQNLIPHVQNFHEFFIGPNSTAIYQAMFAAVGFVLLIACANLANLQLARAIGRSREISVRMALGASRWRIIRQLLIESMMLSAAGGMAGWWIAKWGVRIYSLAVTGAGISDSMAGNWFDNVLGYTMDYQVFAYLVAISMATGVLFGLAPAARLSKLDANHALKDGGRGATGGRRGRRLSELLVIGEMVLAVVLLAGAGVMIRSFYHIYNADIGAKIENVSGALVNLPEDRYPRVDEQISFYDRLKNRLEALPSVESVALGSDIPTAGARRLPYELAGSEPMDEQRRPSVPVLIIGPDYFKTLAAAVQAGREFTGFDGISGLPVAVVNQRFASEHWPAQDPLGQRLRLFSGKTPGAWLTVVGVAPNIVQNDFTRQNTGPVVYLPFRQKPAAAMWVIVRTRVPPGEVTNVFRGEIQAMDSALPTSLGPFPLREYLAWNYQYRQVSGVLFLTFAAIALLLASLGLYAVIAYSVGQRTQEFGVRIAVGATARDILKLVFLQGMIPLGIGLAAGLAASVAVNRILKSQLVHVSPADPIALAVASATLIVAATFGCLIPARRAMRVDPIAALRHE